MSTVAPCLQALGRSDLAGSSLIVLSGLPAAVAARRTAEIHELLPGAEVVSEASPGANRARNRALMHCAADDVVAFLDDDAVIGSSWVAAMRRAWAHAAPEVGVIGGPIRPRFLAPRPRWMSEFTLSGLSILDLGGVARRLDPECELLYSANFALRVHHASAVSGFDPALGPSGKAAGFGDDIDIQRRMGRAGIEIWYEPDAWVEHLIGPERLTRASMLNRRYLTGIDFGRAPSRPLSQVTRELLRSAVGGLAAGVLSRPAVGMDRMSYAAQCAGELRVRLARSE